MMMMGIGKEVVEEEVTSEPIVRPDDCDDRSWTDEKGPLISGLAPRRHRGRGRVAMELAALQHNLTEVEFDK